MTLADPKDVEFYRHLLNAVFTTGTPKWMEKEAEEEDNLIYRLARNTHTYTTPAYLTVGMDAHPKMLRIAGMTLDYKSLEEVISPDNIISCFDTFRSVPIKADTENKTLWVGVGRFMPFDPKTIIQHLLPSPVQQENYSICWVLQTPLEVCRLQKGVLNANKSVLRF